MKHQWGIRLGVVAAATVVLLALSACTEAPSTLSAAQSASPQSKTAGPVTEIAAKDRGKPITLSGTLETGQVIAPGEWAGKVVVANFWYAGCGPCRAEARDLEAVHTKFQAKDVIFVGVNVRDQQSSAKAFATEFGITYPSFLDAESGALQLAFAGKVAPSAVPTTVVIDRRGRVASRILGKLEARSILETLIRDALAEKS